MPTILIVDMSSPMFWGVHLACLIFLLSCFSSSNPQLVINIKNQGGDVLQEVLASNVSEDVVQLEYQRADGTIVTQMLDFRKEVQIYRLLILAEEEQLPLKSFQPPYYQAVCFAAKLSKQDFIAADAIAKLRQKNPHTVRYPEEDNGRENATFEYTLDVSRSNIISNQIQQLCINATAIYVQETDLRLWAAIGNPNEAFMVLDAAQHMVRPASRCKDIAVTNSSSMPCQCRLNFCVPWYPCGLKFCRGHDQQTGKALSYRCGIKTCKKCLDYSFPVKNFLFCPWDDY
ncbi:out at first protein-like [Daphnia pulex]|uniref:out at first protein-like n=1 Tax=Daphnia pulex TaxID=6669 RepID=UPI001EDF66B7|nr:out at first protein-like [Daphnia pulex]